MVKKKKVDLLFPEPRMNLLKWTTIRNPHEANLAYGCEYMCIYACVYVITFSVLTSAGVVRGPVFAGHTHHLWALGLVSLLAAYFTASPHHIPVVLSSGCATAHVTMFHLNGRAPRCPYMEERWLVWPFRHCIKAITCFYGAALERERLLLMSISNNNLPEDYKKLRKT